MAVTLRAGRRRNLTFGGVFLYGPIGLDQSANGRGDRWLKLGQSDVTTFAPANTRPEPTALFMGERRLFGDRMQKTPRRSLDPSKCFRVVPSKGLD
jgi:hypothetical protein